MKKLFTILLTITILCLFMVEVSAETTDNISTSTVTEETIAEIIQETEVTPDIETPVESEPISDSPDSTAIPAVEHLINFFFDGKVTVSQIIEYLAVALTAVLSFAYNKYKRKLLVKEKAISKTDLKIEDLQAKDQDMANQMGLLGNMIVCAYLSNNLVDPELKKKLAVYADELMQNTNLDQDKLTEKLILAAKNPNLQEKITDLKASIDKEAEQAQEDIDIIKEDITALSDSINQDIVPTASDVIDNLKIGG